nr:unnamed protein product [Callosobruchus chinensis]
MLIVADGNKHNQLSQLQTALTSLDTIGLEALRNAANSKTAWTERPSFLTALKDLHSMRRRYAVIGLIRWPAVMLKLT